MVIGYIKHRNSHIDSAQIFMRVIAPVTSAFPLYRLKSAPCYSK